MCCLYYFITFCRPVGIHQALFKVHSLTLATIKYNFLINRVSPTIGLKHYKSTTDMLLLTSIRMLCLYVCVPEMINLDLFYT